MKHTAILLFTLLVGSRLEAAPGDVISSFAAPPGVTRPVGLAVAGAEIWVANLAEPAIPGTVNEIVVVTSTGGVRRRIPAGSSVAVNKLAFDGTHVWVVRTPSIIEQVDQNATQVSSFPTTTSIGITWQREADRIWDLEQSDGTDPSDRIYRRDWVGNLDLTINTVDTHAEWSGLAWDGCTLWTIDRTNDVLVRMDPANGHVRETLAAPGTECAGLSFDGTGLLVSDDQTDRIYLVEIAPIYINGAQCTPNLAPPFVRDAGVLDTGSIDAVVYPDASVPEAGAPDANASFPDATLVDSGNDDAGQMDTLIGSPPAQEDGCGCTNVQASAAKLGFGHLILLGRR